MDTGFGGLHVFLANLHVEQLQQALMPTGIVDIAPHNYDLENFPQCEAKRVLEKLYKKREKDKDESKNRR
ncbi:AAA+ ATPase domain-containing protein [Artemisia annua]|uniref:AAA+ ATPase domain-containing protein n=1 Tax=Artemisia annua TaxID=35608 RepID=A0A2U1L1J1_ARTAN|nr:AAA+ ATPase domain-containing protein [Artemisia annua]